MENRNPFISRMLNFKSNKQETTSKPGVDLDSSSDSPHTTTKTARPGLFSRLHQNLKRDRKDHRSKLVDQKRVLDTPKTTQSTTNLHQMSSHTKKPLATANSVSNLAHQDTSKFTSIFNKFPTKKPPVTATTASTPADDTYLVPSESNNDSNMNTSKSENPSSLRRRKMLEEYIKSKRERQQQDKNKRPAFKVGLAGASSLGLSSSTSKLNTSSCNSSNTAIMPSRATFDFKMNLPKPAELGRTASMRILPSTRSTNLARSNTIKDQASSKPVNKPPPPPVSAAVHKPVTRSNTLKTTTKPSIPPRPAVTSGTGIQRTASVKSTPSTATTKPKLPASKHQKDMDLISKKLTDSVRLNNGNTPSNHIHTTNINSESIIIVDSHNHNSGSSMQNFSIFGYESGIKNMLLDQHKNHHMHHRTSSPIKVDLDKICASPIVPRQLASQLVREDSIEDAINLQPVQQDHSMQSIQKTETVVAEIKPVESVEYFEGVEMSKRDIEYYRLLLTFQTRRLNSLIDEWTAQVEGTQVPEDTDGEIRLACGLAKLLIDERFVQFNGLVNQCEQQNLYDSLNGKDKEEEGGEEAELKVRCTDLQGFWDMVDSQVVDVVKRFDKLARLRANNYVPIEEEIKIVKKKTAAKPKKKEIVVEEAKSEESAPVPKKANKFAEFRAKMKAQKQQQAESSEDVVIEIKTGSTPCIKPTTPVAEEISKSNSKKAGGRRKSRFNQSVEHVPLQSPYNLRSRKSDLICFDSPMTRESLIVNKLPSMAEEGTTMTQSQEPPVIKINKPRKSVRINMEPMVQLVDKDDDEYADNDKENEDFFACDIKKEVVTWCSNEKIANRLSFLPKFESPIRALSNNNTLATPNRTLTNNSNLLDVTPATTASTRLSITMANSPLLKLALISSKSKRLSMTNQSVLDNK